LGGIVLRIYLQRVGEVDVEVNQEKLVSFFKKYFISMTIANRKKYAGKIL
jgi:hypothetical protein